MKEKFKLTALERSWVLYDIGNSAFILMVSTLIPIFFNALASAANVNEDLYLSYWGYAGSVATVLVALIGPICGAIADQKRKKPLFMLCACLGMLGCAALGMTSHWLVFLGIFVVARVGFSSSLVFYDAMLPEITTEERMDKVSTSGYAFGYIGSVIPFIVCLVLVLGHDAFGMSQGSAMTVAFLITALWWLGCTLPLVRRYHQTAFVEEAGPVLDAFRQLGRTLRDARKEKHIFLYLLAFFFLVGLSTLDVIGQHAVILGGGGGGQHTQGGIDKVIGGKGRSVAPLKALPQMEGVDQAVVADVPALGTAGDNGTGGIVGHQAFEAVGQDILGEGVVGDGGVNTVRLVGQHEGQLLRSRLGRGSRGRSGSGGSRGNVVDVAGGSGIAAAGSQAQAHDKGQRKGNKLFHFLVVPFCLLLCIDRRVSAAGSNGWSQSYRWQATLWPGAASFMQGAS